MSEVSSYSYSRVYQTSQNPDASQWSYLGETLLALAETVANAVAVIFTVGCHAKSRERTQFSAKAFGVSFVGVFSPSAAKTKVDNLMQRELFPEQVRADQAAERNVQRTADNSYRNFARLFTMNDFFDSETGRIKETTLAELNNVAKFKEVLTEIEKEVPAHLLLTGEERNQMRQAYTMCHPRWPTALKELLGKVKDKSIQGLKIPAFEEGDWKSMDVEQKLVKIQEAVKIMTDIERTSILCSDYYGRALIDKEIEFGVLSEKAILQTIQDEYGKAEAGTPLPTIWDSIEPRLLREVEQAKGTQQEERESQFQHWVQENVKEDFATLLLHSPVTPKPVRAAFEKFKSDLLEEIRPRLSELEQSAWENWTNSSNAYKTFEAVLYSVASAEAKKQALAQTSNHGDSPALKLIMVQYGINKLLGWEDTYKPEELHLLFNLENLVKEIEAVMNCFDVEISGYTNPLVSSDWNMQQTHEILKSLKVDGPTLSFERGWISSKVKSRIEAEIVRVKHSNEQARETTVKKYQAWQKTFLLPGEEPHAHFLAAQVQFEGALVESEDSLHLPMRPATHRKKMDEVFQAWTNDICQSNLLDNIPNPAKNGIKQ